MQVLTPRVDLASFYERIHSAPERVLILDYDGTLAPFHVRPECAVPYPGVVPALDEIITSGHTRVVIVSGRPVSELPPLLPLTLRPEIWGAHGWERLLPDDSLKVQDPEPAARRALNEAQSAIAELLDDGGRLEHKRASIALHWRGMPEDKAAALKQRATEIWERLARDACVELLPFDCGLELRASGCNKQYAVKAILAATSEKSAIAYLGDDMTDEDAFRAVKTRGLGVLVRSEFRPTEADVWITPPDELLAFIRRWRVTRP